MSQLGVGFEGEPAFEEGDASGGEVSDEGPHRFGCGAPPGVKEEDPLRLEEVLKGFDQLGEEREPAPGIELEDNGAAVEIRHDSGEAVVLAVQEAVPRRFGGGDPCPPVEGLAQAPLEEGLPDLLRLPVHEEANPDRAIGVVESGGQEAVLPVKDDGDVPGLPWMALGGDAPVKEPGVPFADGALRSGVNPQRDPPPAWIRR